MQHLESPFRHIKEVVIVNIPFIYVGRAKFHPESFVCWSKCAMFVSPDFSIAHGSWNSMQRLTSFRWARWQSCNVPIGNKIMSL